MTAKHIVGFVLLGIVALVFGMSAAAIFMRPSAPPPPVEAPALVSGAKVKAKPKPKAKAPGDLLDPTNRAAKKPPPAPVAAPPGSALPATKSNVSALLKTHTVSISMCARSAGLPARVRKVDVTVSFGPTTAGMQITELVARSPEDSRWGVFTECLANELGRTVFKRSEEVPEFLMSVRIP
ncbi:MAG: hypothetical protein ACI8PZ_004186 [Myxococcota bacterium]|jgi:hypothetical protein